MSTRLYSKLELRELKKKYNSSYQTNDAIDKYNLNIISSLDLNVSFYDDCFFIDQNSYDILHSIYKNSLDFMKKKVNYIKLEDLFTIAKEYHPDMPDRYKSVFKLKPLPSDCSDKKTIDKRARWLSFIKTYVQPKAYYKSFLFDEKEVRQFFSNIYNRKEILEYINDKYNKNLNRDSLKYIINKTPKLKDSYVKCLAGNYYPTTTVQAIENIILSEPDYTLSQLSKALGIGFSTMQKYAVKGVIKSEQNTKNSFYKISKDEYNKWINFKTIYIGYKDWSKTKLDSYTFNNNKFLNYIEENNYFNCEIALSIDTCFNFENQVFYFKKEDEQVFLTHALRFENRYKKQNRSTLDKLIELFNSEHPDICSESIKYLKEFYNVKSETTDITRYTNSYFRITNFLIQSLEKNIHLYSDTEMDTLIESYALESGVKADIKILCNFLRYLSKSTKTIYKKEYFYVPDILNNLDVSPYEDSQMFRFALLIFNESYPLYKEYLKKACNVQSNASIWLYSALHYICGWRASDMNESIPRPTLPVDYKTFFDLVVNDNFTYDMGKKIIDEVTYKVKYLNKKPIKTRNSAPPSLVLNVPDSAVKTIGMIIGLCEAHLQKKESIDSTKIIKHEYINRASRNKQLFQRFFGDEVIDIFGDKMFSNRRANKFYELNIATKAEEKQLGTGYIIAGVARSHKFSSTKKSNTTSIYLSEFKNLPRSEVISKNLFERGVCSFIPYLTLKILKGDSYVKSLSIDEQTKQLKEFSNITPYDTDFIIQSYEEVLARCEKEVNEIIKSFNPNSSTFKDDIYNFLERIAFGNAPSKTNDIYCLSVAKGVGCIHKTREHCVGCGQEIYLKTSLHVIGKTLSDFINKAQACEHNTSKQKYLKLSNYVIKPILSEILTTLKTVYKIEDLSECKKIVLGK